MSSLYKYCPIYNVDKLDGEYSIINVLNHQVTFSTRGNFNDLFDSKIDFMLPTKLELKRVHSSLKGAKKREFKTLFLGDSGKQNFLGFKKRVIEKIDTYLFFCLADKADNNLMWSHYANSHKGFCLEWDASLIEAHPVVYQDQIASFALLDVVKEQYGLVDRQLVQDKIWQALKVKLNEWRYEGEYRVQLGAGMKDLIKSQNDKFAVVSYNPRFIKSIIFGCRMDKRVIKYLDERLPKHVERRYAKERSSHIEIVSKN